MKTFYFDIRQTGLVRKFLGNDRFIFRGERGVRKDGDIHVARARFRTARNGAVKHDEPQTARSCNALYGRSVLLFESIPHHERSIALRPAGFQ